MSALNRYLEGTIELPLFSIRARPVPPEPIEETGRAEARGPMRVDEEKAMTLMLFLRDNLSRLSGKRAAGAGKGTVFSARQVADYATQLGLPIGGGRKKEDNVLAIKEKMRELKVITNVNG